MFNNPSTESINPLKRGDTNLMRMPESEFKNLLNSIDNLQDIIYELAHAPANDHMQVAKLIRSILLIIGDEIVHISKFSHSQNSTTQLQSWENEGGRTDSGSTQ